MKTEILTALIIVALVLSASSLALQLRPSGPASSATWEKVNCRYNQNGDGVTIFAPSSGLIYPLWNVTVQCSWPNGTKNTLTYAETTIFGSQNENSVNLPAVPVIPNTDGGPWIYPNVTSVTAYELQPPQ